MFDAHAFGRLLWRGRRRLLERDRAALQGEFVRTRQADLRVLDVRRPGASAGTLVIVPDPPNVIEHVMPIIDAFSADFRVVAFELPGFGHSYPNADFRADVVGQAECFEELFRRLDIRDAVLDMSCLGAYMGMVFAQAQPGRVRHLMLQQVPAFAEAQAWARKADVAGLIRTPWIGQLFMRAMYRKVADHWYHSALPADHDQALHAHYAGPTFRALERGGCFCLGDAYQGLFAQSSLPLAGLACPATVVWGSADRTHADTSKRSALQDVPHAHFVEFAHCGHFPALEDPGRYHPLLREVLARA